jgi:hypothetical protein
MRYLLNCPFLSSAILSSDYWIVFLFTYLLPTLIPHHHHPDLLHTSTLPFGKVRAFAWAFWSTIFIPFWMLIRTVPVMYFLRLADFLWLHNRSHPRAGGDPYQLAGTKQLFYRFPPSREWLHWVAKRTLQVKSMYYRHCSDRHSILHSIYAFLDCNLVWIRTPDS